MKIKSTLALALALLALGTSTLLVSAQDNNNDGPPGGGRQGGPGMGGKRPVPPVMTALDANHDGTIDADEIANASAALKTLDKNGDGKLTPDELRPARPAGGHGGPEGAGGPPEGGAPPQQ